jgi:3-phosphoshikimate 1-carboxyvinyltransferase
MKEIKTQKIADCQVTVPGSKSYTHRMLIAAAMANGVSTLKNALVSEDTQFTMDALRQMGIQVEVNSDEVFHASADRGGSAGQRDLYTDRQCPYANAADKGSAGCIGADGH